MIVELPTPDALGSNSGLEIEIGGQVVIIASIGLCAKVAPAAQTTQG